MGAGCAPGGARPQHLGARPAAGGGKCRVCGEARPRLTEGGGGRNMFNRRFERSGETGELENPRRPAPSGAGGDLEKRILEETKNRISWERSEDRDQSITYSMIRAEHLFCFEGAFFERRVRSWLRMNAGGVPNTCKSNG